MNSELPPVSVSIKINAYRLLKRGGNFNRKELCEAADEDFCDNLADETRYSDLVERMGERRGSGSPDESEVFSNSSDASDSAVEEVLRDVAESLASRSGSKAVIPNSRPRPPCPLPNPTRLWVAGIEGVDCLIFNPTDTFAHVQRAIALKYGLALSWLTIQQWENPYSVRGYGSHCFCNLEKDSTLQDSFIGCQGEVFDGADAGITATSPYGPLRISASGFWAFMAIDIFPCDRVCELKRRIAAKKGITAEDQRSFFNGRELPDDFTLEDLEPPHPRGSRETVLRLGIRLHDPLRISIQDVSGDRFGLEVESGGIVSDIKAQIQSQTGIGIEDQCLFLPGQKLPNDDLVSDWSIEDGFTLHLVRPSTREREPAREVRRQDEGENGSIEVKIPDLESNTFSSITVGRQERIADFLERFGYDANLLGFWSADRLLWPKWTFEDYSIRDGSVIHFKVRWQIFVRTLNGQCRTFEFAPNDLVWDLKLGVEAAEGIPPAEQRLIYRGRQLSDDLTLQEAGVNHDAIIHLVLRLRA
jgi:hypothetical protein